MSKFKKEYYIGREFILKNFDKPIIILDARQVRDEKYINNPKCVSRGLPVEVMYRNSNEYEDSLFWCRYDCLTDKRGDKVRNYLKLNTNGCYYGAPVFKSTSRLDSTWRHMWERCLDKDRVAYINTTVDTRWKSYQKFLEWVYSENSNYIESEEQDLDKDILQFGKINKIYSPETCLFIPSILNTYLSGISKRNGGKLQALCFGGEYLRMPSKYITDKSSNYIRYYFLKEIIKIFKDEAKLNRCAYKALKEYNLEVHNINKNLIYEYINKEIVQIINKFITEIFKK